MRTSWQYWLAGLGLALLAVYLGLTPTGGWDIWWHMRTGELALEQLSTLPTDPFSHTFAGQVWGHKDLLADVLLYLGFDTLGFAWFALLKGLVVACVGWAVFRAGRRGGAPVAVAALFAGLAIAAVEYRLVERPVVFSLALFPLLVLLLHRLRELKSESRPGELAAALLPVVALLWLWSWLHREAIVGLGLFGLHVCGHAIARLLAPPDERPAGASIAAMALALCAALLLPLLSPSGWHFYESAFFAARSPELREVISDWARIGPVQLARDFPVTVVLLLLALPGCAGSLARLRTARSPAALAGAVQVAALIFFACMALLDSVRWLPYLSLSAAFLALAGSTGVGGGRLKDLATRASRARLALPVVAALVLGAAALLNNRGLGLGPMPDSYPDGAVRFAREHGLRGKVVNAFHLGGYLIWELWPETRVSIDGRNDVLYPPRFLIESLESQRRPEVFRRMRERDRATWVVAGNAAGRVTHAFLARSPDWMLVYWSEPAAIYVRREIHADLSRYELRYVDPAAVDESVVEAVRGHRARPEALDEIGAEVRRLLAASPHSLRANAAAALYFHFRGPAYHARRDEVLARIQSLHPGHPAAAELAQRIRAD